MKKLKIVKNEPLRFLDSEKDINSTVSGRMDLTKLNSEQTDKAFKQINKFLKKHKDKGVIVTKSQEKKQFVCVNLNSGANKKNILSFPEPNPITLNYISANENLEKALSFKNKLLKVDTNNADKQFSLFSEYYRLSSIGTVFLISSIEAFLNLWIPVNPKIDLEINGKTHFKEELEYLDFTTKFSVMIPAITGKNFSKDFPKAHGVIMTCNSIRDDIIHLKKENNANGSQFENIFKRLFDLPILEASNATFDLINFYNPNFMTEEIEQIII